MARPERSITAQRKRKTRLNTSLLRRQPHTVPGAHLTRVYIFFPSSIAIDDVWKAQFRWVERAFHSCRTFRPRMVRAKCGTGTYRPVIITTRNPLHPAGELSAVSEDSAVYTVPIASDSHGALTTVHSEGQKARTKHFDIRYHAVRDLERKRHITFGYVPSADNAAHVGTKALDKVPHWHMVGLLGLG
jgi:hypothetical protein